MRNNATPPPAKPGVYILVHRATGATYVGSTGNLRQRRTVWRTDLKAERGSKKVRGLPDLPVEEWEFKTVRVMEGATPAELRAVVDETVARAERQGLKPVGRPAPAAAKPGWDQRAHALSLMPVPIHDADGRALTYAEVAAVAGRSFTAVKEAAKRIRTRGQHRLLPVSHIGIDQIIATTRPLKKT